MKNNDNRGQNRNRSLRLLKNNKPCKKTGFIVNLKPLQLLGLFIWAQFYVNPSF